MRVRILLLLTCFLISISAQSSGSFTIKTIVIDAGHGGKDPGAIGQKGTNEKNVALSVAMKLGKSIQANYPNVKVIYTRTTDVFLELHERAEIANRNKADLFIAVHCNSNTNPDAYGSSTYVLGLHRSEANLEVAKRENSVILLEEDRDKNYEFDPNTPEGHIIMSMKQNAFLDQSIDFASKIENQMENEARRKSLGVKQAGFYVLYKTAMPSLLAEIGFISNPEEEKFLSSEKGQDEIANALSNAFKDYKMLMEKGDASAAVEDPVKEVKKETPAQKEPVVEKTEPVKEEPKPTEVKPAKTDVKPKEDVAKTEPKVEPVASEPQPTSEYVTLQNGKTIKRPIDVNNSGGGKSTMMAKVSVKPSSPATPSVEKDPAPKKVEPAPLKKEEPVKAEDPSITTIGAATPKVTMPKSTPSNEPKSSASTSVMGASFKVQLFALKTALQPADRDKLVRLFPNYSTEMTPTGFTRYYGATTKTVAEARRLVNTAKANGYKEAFLVGFRDGRRMSADELQAAEGQ